MSTPEQQDEQTAAVLVETIDRFFEEVDPDSFESEDLAWALIRAMKRELTSD